MGRSSKFLAIGFATICAFSTQALVLTFDEAETGYSGTIDLIPDVAAGYGGFDWSDFGLVHGFDYATGSGYDNGTVSGEYAAFNGFGDSASMGVSSPQVFDYIGGYFTAAWNDGLTIEVEAYLNGSLVGSDSIVVDTTGPVWWQVDFFGIDELVFSSFGGVDAGHSGTGTHFVMDNFTYELNNPVPEPATMTLLGLGIVGLAARSRKARKSA